MSEIENKNGPDNETLLSRIESLEKRLIHVESLLRIEWVGKKEPIISTTQSGETVEVETTESSSAPAGDRGRTAGPEPR